MVSKCLCLLVSLSKNWILLGLLCKFKNCYASFKTYLLKLCQKDLKDTDENSSLHVIWKKKITRILLENIKTSSLELFQYFKNKLYLES